MSDEIIAKLIRVERISFSGTDCYDTVPDKDGNIRMVKISAKTAAVIDIKGKEAIIWPETLDMGTSIDGDALFVYEPPNQKDNGFIDAFDFDNDYDSAYRGVGTFIVRLPKDETEKARKDINLINNISKINNPPAVTRKKQPRLDR